MGLQVTVSPKFPKQDMASFTALIISEGMRVFYTLSEIFIESFDAKIPLTPEVVGAVTSLNDVDDLDMLEFIMAIEDHFDITIDDEIMCEIQFKSETPIQSLIDVINNELLMAKRLL